MWLTSSIRWTFVVDSFSSWGSLPWHREEMLVFAYLMRRYRRRWETHRKKSEMKSSLVGEQKKKKKTTRTNTYSHAHTRRTRRNKKRETDRSKAQKTHDSNQCSPAAAPNLIPLYILRALCRCHCLSTVSHSLFILPPLFIHLFSTPPSLS